ncbi:MAG TPA: PLDc N-terminal domain-containing protein [Tepidisphaeraceae bacterium]|nr:PLDc N-terminal domain-containing protein [Tepidisphaeraceae bacterium]
MYPGMGLLVLVLDIYVIYLIANGSGDTGTKLGWVILVLFLPLLGPILYLLLGRGNKRT